MLHLCISTVIGYVPDMLCLCAAAVKYTSEHVLMLSGEYLGINLMKTCEKWKHWNKICRICKIYKL